MRSIFPNGDELLRIFKRQRPQEDGVDDAKIALFASMPSARAITATAVKPGFFLSMRTA